MKKRIRIENADELQAAITEAEGRAKVRLMLAEEVQEAAEEFEKRTFNPSKKALKGCRLTIQAEANTVANSYYGTPCETVVTLEHDTKGWFLYAASRQPMRGHSWNCQAYYMSEELQQHIVYKAATF